MRRKVFVAFGLLLVGLMAAGAEKYIVASDMPWPPFEWVSPEGNYLGFDLDIMRCIAVLMGYEIEIRPLAFDSIIPAVRLGEVDIGASGFTITAEREEVVDFSEPYWTSNQAVIIRKDSGLNVVTALAGYGPTKKIGAQRGTTGAAWVEDNLVKAGVPVKLVLYESYPEAVLDLVNGRLDAVVQDEPASKQSVEAYPELIVAGILVTYENFGFLVAEGDPKGILPKINKGMEIMKALGAWDYLVKAYFGPPLEKVEVAWKACIDTLYNKDLTPEERVLRYTKCLAEKSAG